MTSPEKRCLYEVLGLHRDCTADEIRSAYRKLALQRHPDKLIKSGVTEAEATASFQELVNAYEVLSDARERSWYDSHRSQILFSGSNANNSFSGSAVVPDLFSFFSNSVFTGFSDKGKGFYKVYADVFDKIYRNELNFAKTLGLGNVVKEAPLMGNLDSPYAQVNAFYGYWLGFVTVMDFVWVDEYDAMNGPNRKSRRLMEDENKKIRKKAKREYNETVRGLAEFVKKRDKRVIDMQVKRNEEIEKKKEEERLKKKELAREKAEKARAYEEPDWAKAEGDLVDEVVEEEVDERKNELYCVVCSKKFKSDKQWKNHEQSKKHKEKVAELREAFEDEEHDDDDDDDDDDDGNGEISGDEYEVEKLKEQFEDVVILTEEKEDDEEESQSEEEILDLDNGGNGVKDDGDDDNDDDHDDDDDDDDDDEDSVLKAMLKNRKNLGSKRKPKKVYVEDEVEAKEVDLMEYNNVRGRRNRRGRKDTHKKDENEERQIIDKPEISSKDEVDENCDDGLRTDQPSSSETCADNENNGGKVNEPIEKVKVSKQVPATEVNNKKEVKPKSKISTRGKKQKPQAKSRNYGNECDTCGADFDSRTKLHKHLNDSGHAAIKSR